MDSRDFHAKWFGRSATITPPTREERQQRKMDYLRNLASSPLAEELVERFELPEIREAEDAFKQALAGISDLTEQRGIFLGPVIDNLIGRIPPCRYRSAAP